MKYSKLIFYMFIFIFLLPVGNCLFAETNRLSVRDSVKMVIIGAGEFLMGSKSSEGRPDERPQNKIYISAYKIDANEVSNKRYLKFIKKTDRKEPPNPYGEKPLSEVEGVSELPVVQITWYDAVDYCRWAGKRLPTEAEWEKAARGSKGFVYPWGFNPPEVSFVNFQKQWEGKKTLWPANLSNESNSPYGLVGMAGNAREWVYDWYSPNYFSKSSKENPQGPKNGILKVIKGGSWHSFKSDLRSASRGKGGFALKTDGIGFRCAQTIIEK